MARIAVRNGRCVLNPDWANGSKEKKCERQIKHSGWAGWADGAVQECDITGEMSGYVCV